MSKSPFGGKDASKGFPGGKDGLAISRATPSRPHVVHPRGGCELACAAMPAAKP